MKCPKEENDLSIPKERSKNEGSKCFTKKGINLRGRKKETNFCSPIQEGGNERTVLPDEIGETNSVTSRIRRQNWKKI